MSRNGSSDRYPQPHRHGIPDHSTDPFERIVGIRSYEPVPAWERLEDRTFPQREPPVLLRMAEAAIAEAVKLRRDGWRRLVPLHAAVNTRITPAAFFSVAIGTKSSWPITPGTAGLRGSNALQISSREGTGAMEGVSFTHLACTKRRKCSQDISDFSIFTGPVRWRDEFDRPEARRDYDESAAMLRNSVIGTVDYPSLGVIGEMETFIGENRQEVMEDFVTLQFGDVLHAHNIGFQLSDESAEISEQGPLWVTVVLEPLGVFRKCLAGRAPDEDARMTFWVLTSQVAASEFGDALVVEFHSGVVVFVWKSAHLIDVVTGGNIHARVQEAAGQPTRSAKDVDCCCGYSRGIGHLVPSA
jgi:hypothetical protein